ncbi:SemiSWEET family sugar transporter [Nakamurella antarctica]|uniref:SemiSWEET family sugar transporter n=1 Tax=Nakamurella antarctica TaxID=1902245 RepID=UPI0013DDC940|nr:SemiSWEET family transporter [Nakamurella antarctica]
MSIPAALGWLAAFLSACLTIPQVARILRTRSVAGLNLLTWQTLLIAGLSWTVYGILVENPQIIGPNAILIVGSGATLIQLQRSAKIPSFRVWALPVAVSATSVGLDVWLGPFVFAFCMCVPAITGQIAQLRQIRVADDVRGVSPAMLLVNTAAQVLWLTYALLVWEVAVIWVAGPLVVVMAANFVALIFRRRHLALEHSLSRSPQSAGAAAQVAGMHAEK